MNWAEVRAVVVVCLLSAVFAGIAFMMMSAS